MSKLQMSRSSGFILGCHSCAWKGWVETKSGPSRPNKPTSEEAPKPGSMNDDGSRSIITSGATTVDSSGVVPEEPCWAGALIDTTGAGLALAPVLSALGFFLGLPICFWAE